LGVAYFDPRPKTGVVFNLIEDIGNPFEPFLQDGTTIDNFGTEIDRVVSCCWRGLHWSWGWGWNWSWHWLLCDQIGLEIESLEIAQVSGSRIGNTGRDLSPPAQTDDRARECLTPTSQPQMMMISV
jgi:hypothetical protein